jgi:hypothetical protein
MEVFGIDKENFETYVDEFGKVTLSDAEWEKVADEIEGRVETYLDEVLQLIAQDYLEGYFDENEGEN